MFRSPTPRQHSRSLSDFPLSAKPELLMLAMLPDDEVQIARLLTSWVELSVNVAVAVNCWVAPAGIVALPGVTATERITAGATVIEVEPITDPEVAAIFAEPKAFPVNRPSLLHAHR